MDKPTEIFDRDPEWEELRSCWLSRKPELYIVIGRRRAGKSFLLTHFSDACKGLYYQATKQTEKEQLRALSRVVGEHFGDAAFQYVAFPAWEDLFSYIIQKTAGEPLLLILDEFPYLSDAAPALPSILQKLWDHDLPGTRIKLILSGSHITAMKRLTESDQPLYGRRTGRIDIPLFDYMDAVRFVPGYSARDKLLAYAMFGGLPGHLELIDPDRPLLDNVIKHILNPSGRLYDEAAHVFDAFVADAEAHYSILEAIAGGETRWNKISNRIGKNTASVKRPLDWLQAMEVVKREAPITEYPNPAPKTLRYSITDPYLVFWHRFIADIKIRGLASLRRPEELWRAYVAPRLDGHMGEVFEESCRIFVARNRLARFPFDPIQVGAWWTEDGQEEIDVVALGPNGEVLLGECKWGKVAASDLDTLQRRSALVVPRIKSVSSLAYALFSGRGFKDAIIEGRIADGEALHFSLDEMLPGPTLSA